MSKNLYRLQTVDGQDYKPCSMEQANRLVGQGKARWVGTDYDEEKDAFVHYADRTTDG